MSLFSRYTFPVYLIIPLFYLPILYLNPIGILFASALVTLDTSRCITTI